MAWRLQRQCGVAWDEQKVGDEGERDHRHIGHIASVIGSNCMASCGLWQRPERPECKLTSRREGPMEGHLKRPVVCTAFSFFWYSGWSFGVHVARWCMVEWCRLRGAGGSATPVRVPRPCAPGRTRAARARSTRGCSARYRLSDRWKSFRELGCIWACMQSHALRTYGQSSPLAVESISLRVSPMSEHALMLTCYVLPEVV